MKRKKQKLESDGVTKLRCLFGDKRIIGIAGEKSSGKTNNIVSLIIDFLGKKPDVPVYCYGLPKETMEYLAKDYGVREISGLTQLVRKKNCLLVIDEFQKLKLNDRRHKEQLAEFIDFVYHNNVYVMLSTPNIREFNNVIGGVIERWVLKNVREDLCVNGSQLKKVITAYKGSYKSLGAVTVPVNELLVINEHEELVITCDYVEAADTKRDLRTLL